MELILGLVALAVGAVVTWFITSSHYKQKIHEMLPRMLDAIRAEMSTAEFSENVLNRMNNNHSSNREHIPKDWED